MTILKSSFPSHEIDASKNQFHIGIDPFEGIGSMESMPGILKNSGSAHAESAGTCKLPNIFRTLQYFIISRYLNSIYMYINENKNV
jgi:hypothetical protein